MYTGNKDNVHICTAASECHYIYNIYLFYILMCLICKYRYLLVWFTFQVSYVIRDEIERCHRSGVNSLKYDPQTTRQQLFDHHCSGTVDLFLILSIHTYNQWSITQIG